MSREIIDNLDVDDLVQRYESGQSMNSIADTLGVSYTVVRNRLLRAGVIRTGSEATAVRHARNRAARMDVGEVVEQYLSGVSEKEIAARIGIHRGAIRKVLLDAGVDPRGRGAAMTVRMSRTSPEERRRLAAAAHAAVRGRVRSNLEVQLSASTREWITAQISPREVELMKMLMERGVDPIPQLAVHRYNIDLAVWPVAVEVHQHTCNPLNFPRLLRRIEHLRERQWLSLYVWVRPGQPFTDSCADKVVSLIQLAQSDPSAFGEHRVIRGTGQDATRPRGKLYRASGVA